MLPQRFYLDELNFPAVQLLTSKFFNHLCNGTVPYEDFRKAFLFQ